MWKADYLIQDSYQYYRKVGTPPLIPRDLYNKIAGEYYSFLSDQIVDGYDVQLPGGLGCIEVGGKIPKIGEGGSLKCFPIDWGSTIKLWKSKPELKKSKKIIRFVNEHTNFVKYKIQWKAGALANKRFYKFSASRGVNSIRRKVHLGILAGKEYNIYK